MRELRKVLHLCSEKVEQGELKIEEAHAISDILGAVLGHSPLPFHAGEDEAAELALLARLHQYQRDAGWRQG